jgi:hypothetical protein
MAAKFRKVDPRIWTDEKFRKLTAEGRLLALWMLSSSRVNRCGIVLWSPGLASEETGIPQTRIDTVCDTVCDTLRWIRDTVSNTVFLCRWWRYNRPDNVKALQGALSDLHDVPSHCLKSALVDAMQDLPASLHTVYRQALDTVCHTVCHTVSPQEQEQEKEKEQEQEKEKETPPKPPRGRQRRIPTTAADILKDLDIPEALGHDAAAKQAVMDWLEHKDRIGNQYASSKSFGVELARWGPIGPTRFTAAVAYSIGKEWKGIYEETTNGRTNQHQPAVRGLAFGDGKCADSL